MDFLIIEANYLANLPELPQESRSFFLRSFFFKSDYQTHTIFIRGRFRIFKNTARINFSEKNLWHFPGEVRDRTPENKNFQDLYKKVQVKRTSKEISVEILE